MAERFELTIDIGANAPVSVVAGVVADIATVSNSATELAGHLAEAAARELVDDLLRRGGPRAVLDEAQARELPLAYGDEAEAFEGLQRYWSPCGRSGSFVPNNLRRPTGVSAAAAYCRSTWRGQRQ